jgi:tetratricopeptide (TPR) repeat protein
MREYAARYPDDANALDSTGDVCFMFGKFADAAGWYLKADQKNSRLLNSGDLYKAAWAQFRLGDVKKADASFAKFRDARARTPDAAFPAFEADWLFRTGREREGLGLLRQAAYAAPKSVASALLAQLVVLDLISKDRAAAAKDASAEAQQPPGNLSTIARFSALPSASPAEWESRAERLLRGSGIEAARQYTLGIALLLDGKREAAIPIWEKISAGVPATDFFPRALLAKLKREKPAQELVPDALVVNPVRALLDKTPE